MQFALCCYQTAKARTLCVYVFFCHNTPRERMGDSSLNLVQAHLTQALAASSTLPPAPSVSPKYQNLGTHSNFTFGSISTSLIDTMNVFGYLLCSYMNYV